LGRRGQAISEANYIQYEQSINQLVQQYGLPKGMYDTPDSISKMLLNNVSPQEAQQRASAAAVAAYSVPDSVRNAFAARVGVVNTNGGLIAAYLDDTKALPLLEQQFASSQVAGAAADAKLSQALDTTTADELAARGINYQAALQGFQQVAGAGGLEQGFGETATEQVDRRSAGDAQAQAATTRVQRGRLARFTAAARW
jgi:hypothetical protein